MKSRYIACLLTIALLFGNNYANARNSICTSEVEENKADALLDNLYDSWENIYQYYNLYGKHDCFSEGYFGEGIADAVVKRLADHWESLNDLANITSKNKGFKKYILNKIDATVADDDLIKIHSLANEECPKGLSVLCKNIDTEVIRAFTELGGSFSS